jgi:hypothetical protein
LTDPGSSTGGLHDGAIAADKYEVEDDQAATADGQGTLDGFGPDVVVIERVALGESDEGKLIAAAFVEDFGRYMDREVRPVLRGVAGVGGEPQLLVNGLAELLRLTADAIEFPVGVERPPRAT